MLMDINGDTKMLLLKDLCSRLPYGVKVTFAGYSGREDCILNSQHLNSTYAIEYLRLRPYLRPMSSMTDEEKRHVSKMMCLKTYDNGVVYDIPYDVYTPYYVMEDCLNYLRSIHVDYSGLIEKGLAIKAPEGIYNN